MDGFLWWRDGVIYQIYPRSFADSNADGLGDLPGILSRLDYLKDLGVDALWLSPFYPTPDADFGYDVSDHCAVDARFGTMQDFDNLVAGAHGRGMRIVLDMVMNHTSDQHAWFKESRSSLNNPKRDWYLWREHRNNWQAWFGGSAWELDGITGEYYYHMFLPQQPDVNWHNPQVRQAQLDVFRFWLERGVDGFRLDVFNAYFKAEDFPDNPPGFGLRRFDRQSHVHDANQPEMIPFLGELRTLLDSYPERYAVGEAFLSSLVQSASYSGEGRLHAVFSFDLFGSMLNFPWNPGWLARRIRRREARFSGDVPPTTVLSNHDQPRTASRYARGEDDTQARLAMALLLTLRGTPFLYYGEEIGMRQIKLRRREIMDPPGRRYWPLFKTRDGCRAPMQWDDSLYAGFSTHKPWLPLHPDYPARNVACQQADPNSMLNFTRALISLRRGTPALRRGDCTVLDCTSSKVLVYVRQVPGQRVLVLLNFSRRAVKVKLEACAADEIWQALFPAEAEPPRGGQVTLPGGAVWLFRAG